MSGHLALVPLSQVDAHTAGALEYAESLAPSVIALHLRVPKACARIEDQWPGGGFRQPLVIVDATDGDQAGALRRALDVLREMQQPERITIVVPWRAADAGDDELGLEDLVTPADGRAPITVQQAPYTK